MKKIMRRLVTLSFVLALSQSSCRTTPKDQGGFDSSLSEVFLKSEAVIDKDTFTKHRVESSGRSNEELEVVMTLKGLKVDAIRDIGLNHLTEGRSIVKPHHAKAWLFGGYYRPASKHIGLEVIDWSLPGNGDPLANQQLFREEHPYFWMNVTSSRIDKSKSGNFKVKPSFDYFVDVYYDTNEFALADNNIVVRARIRFDSPNTLSRMLIQSKIGGGIDPKTGMKSTKKQDIRLDGFDIGSSCNDGSNCWNAVNQLDEIVKSGVGKGVFSPNKGVSAIAAVYEHLSEKSPSSLKGPKKELRLQPAAAVLSRRARYHLDKTDTNDVGILRKFCLKAVENIKERLIAFGDEQAIFLANQIGEIMSLTGMIEREVRTRILPGYKGELRTLIPEQNKRALDYSEVVQSHKVVNYQADKIREWVNQSQALLKLKGEDIKLLTQARTFGQMYKTLWYREAFKRVSGYFPSGNLIIDTFDYSQSMTIAEFEKLTHDEVRWQAPFDKDLKKYNVLEAAIVNEVQIELTEVGPFIRNLSSSDPAKREIAQIIMNEVKKLQFAFARRRFPELKRDLDRLGYKGFSWEVADESKGQRAIRYVRERNVNLKKRWYCDPNNPYPNQSCYNP